MSVILRESSPFGPWIRKEIELDESVKVGGRGQTVKRVQEWLNLHNYGLVIDGEFGPVTKKQVAHFQEDRGFPTTGIVTARTFQALVAPLLAVLEPKDAPQNFPGLVLKYARSHLKHHPREVGGKMVGHGCACI